MNAEECARLVSIVRSLYPAQRFDDNPENVVRAWGHVVADVSFAEAHAAVVRLARRAVPWVSPGEVRREAAAARHVLSPDVDALLSDMREVARREGIGRRQLHPAAQAAYDVVGGASSIVRMDARALLQLRRVLDEQCAKYDRRVLDEPLLPPQPEHVPIAQQAQPTPELEASPPEPLSTEEHRARVAQLRAYTESGRDE